MSTTEIVMAALAALALILNFSQTRKQGIETNAQLKSDIKYIKERVDAVASEQGKFAAIVIELTTRVTRCEESCKQAHHRMTEHIQGPVRAAEKSE